MEDDLLRERIARLETNAKRERVVAIGLFALLMATAQAPVQTSGPIVVSAAAGSATLDSTGLTMRDKTNIVRTFAGLDSDGDPSIDLTDSTAHLRESMYLLNDGPILRDFDTAGKRRLEMYLSADSSDGTLNLRDASEVTRLSVFRGSQGLPEFGLYGSDGKVRAYLSADDAMAYLVMKDNAATTRLVMGAYTGGKIGMDLRDAAGKELWSQPK